MGLIKNYKATPMLTKIKAMLQISVVIHTPLNVRSKLEKNIEIK